MPMAPISPGMSREPQAPESLTCDSSTTPSITWRTAIHLSLVVGKSYDARIGIYVVTALVPHRRGRGRQPDQWRDPQTCDPSLRSVGRPDPTTV